MNQGQEACAHAKIQADGEGTTSGPHRGLSCWIEAVLWLTAICFTMLACADKQTNQPVSFGQLSRAIVDGVEETGFSGAGALVGIFEDGHFTGSFCSATLIDPKWVLTAAHCIDGIADRARQRRTPLELSLIHI